MGCIVGHGSVRRWFGAAMFDLYYNSILIAPLDSVLIDGTLLHCQLNRVGVA